MTNKKDDIHMEDGMEDGSPLQMCASGSLPALTSGSEPSAVRERPILFSAPMVRAILDGRKTQTRRVIKFVQGAFACACGHPRWHSAVPGDWHCGTCGAGVRGPRANFRGLVCPYGDPGDLLWVREAWKAPERLDSTAPRDIPPSTRISYMADDRLWPCSRGRPGIHMPRWASRITLRITDVRVERLVDCSDADAFAEGIRFTMEPTGAGGKQSGWGIPGLIQGNGPAHAYSLLWEQINGPGSWEANPWVWVVEFERANGSAEGVAAQVVQPIREAQ